MLWGEECEEAEMGCPTWQFDGEPLPAQLDVQKGVSDGGGV